MALNLGNIRFVAGKFNFSAAMVVAILVSFSVILHVFVVNDAYYVPMICLMFASPFLLMTKRPLVIDLEDIIIVGIAVFMFIAALRHIDSFRLSTLLFSCMYLITYSYYKRLLPVSGLKCETYIKLLEGIIIAYAAVLAIQQISVFLGLPVFNLSYGHFSDDSMYKQGSLAMEASSSGPILSIFVYSLLRIYEIKNGKKATLSYLLREKKWLAISFIYVCIASLSITCIVSFFLIAIYMLPRRHMAAGFAVVLTILLAIAFSQNVVGVRIRALIPALLSLDAIEIYKTDPSSAARIAPFLLYISDINPASSDFWLGYGCDYGALHVFSEITGNLQDESMGVGGIISFIYDYGFIAFMIFAAFLCICCRDNKYAILMFALEFFMCPFNHYSIWLFFIVVFSTSFYRKEYRRKEYAIK